MSTGKEEQMEEEEEYLLLDLDSVRAHIRIPPNAAFVLSGLDTLNPVLIINDKIKLIGEYEETIGTCIVFNETEVAQEETRPSEDNSFLVDSKQTPTKQVNPIACLHKVLKFRLFMEADTEDRVDEKLDTPSLSSNDTFIS